MKKVSKIYLFLTSLFFLFSPFALGIEDIYFEDTSLVEHISGLIVNSALILIMGVTIAILIKNKKLKAPNLVEIKYLIFGFLSNVVIYFYAFQNSLNIEKFITIYFTMIIILLLYQIIIDRKTINYELWIFALLFFIVDFIHFEYIYVEDSNGGYFPNNLEANFIQRVLFISVPVATLALYASKIRKYKVMDWFSYVFIALTVLITLVFFESIDVEDKLILTFNLLIPFVILIDIILSIIYKRFRIYKLTFYVRMGTIIMLIYIYNGLDYFSMYSYSDHNLIELVMITYIAVICNLVEYLVPKKEIA